MEGTPYIRSISLINEEPIELASSGVLALVGANNSGKTHFLNLVHSHLHGATVNDVARDNNLFTAIDIGWRGGVHEVESLARKRAHELLTLTPNGYRINNGVQYPGSQLIRDDQFLHVQSNRNSLGIFTDLYLEFDDAIDRVKEVDVQQQTPPWDQAKKRSLTQLSSENSQASELIRTIFHRIFHKEISYYDLYGQIGFLLTPAPAFGTRAGSALDEATKRHMQDSPKMWNQGLGMRSVLGLLLKIFATNKDIIIIDEPEAFLHPPQAAALGNVLAEIASKYRKQILLATHDRNLLSGLLKHEEAPIQIQRLTRVSDQPTITSIKPDQLSNVRDMSLIRYTTIFDSLFVRMTVLVENEKDAYFYSEAIESILLKYPEAYRATSIDEILFISTNGTGAIARTAELVSSIQSNVIVACDLDLLANRARFFQVVRAVTNQELEGRESSLAVLYDSVLSKMGVSHQWDQKSKDKAFKTCHGIASENHDLREEFTKLFNELDPLGVVLNPVGELEDFSKHLVTKKRKAEWAQVAIQSKVHESALVQDYAQRMLEHLQKL